MSFIYSHEITQQFEKAIKHEWLETNGLGGWAGSSIIGAHTRRYHGLLVAATDAPVGRKVLLSKLDETVHVHDRPHELSCNRYQNAVHPTGYIFLNEFRRDIFPEFTYKINGISLKKTVVAVHGENTTLVLYEVLRANKPFCLELLPLYAPRDHHTVTQGRHDMHTGVESAADVFRTRAFPDAPELFIQAPGARFHAAPDWYYQFEYEAEQKRGEASGEDLFTPGKFYVDMQAGDRLGIIISTENPTGRDAFTLMEIEKQRRLQLIAQAGAKSDLSRHLVLAADQFIVNRGKNLKTIIAGYHWFTDWGRDAMIALPGLCLSTERLADARKILKAFASHVDQGMIPNNFKDQDGNPVYNSVDATLWFFVAVYRYLKHTDDRDFVCRELLPVLDEIIRWHYKGTRFGIGVNEEGLLHAGEDGVALTWMDAQAGDWAATPRTGLPVEVNALWYNVLRIYAHLKKVDRDIRVAREFENRARQVKRAFNQVFWNTEANCLYDLVSEAGTDARIRPNQLFAISLPFDLLSPLKAQRVLAVVEQQLYTPMGLRSLSPHDPGYVSAYRGDRMQRDAAYHQGTAWSWLLGPYIDALIKVKGEVGKYQSLRVVRDFVASMGEIGVGSFSEIFDGGTPFKARGCIAQAWSVAEVLRVCKEYQLIVPMQVPEMAKGRRQMLAEMASTFGIL